MIRSLAFEKITVDHLPAIHDLRIDVLRLDRIHSLVSGNKWFKLKYYLQQAMAEKKKGIISFGGAWSNHILSVAAVCKELGLSSIGIIRGEQPAKPSSTLIQARELGMQLMFSNRTDYQKKIIAPFEGSENYYVIPEGGCGPSGVQGASTLLDHCHRQYTHYCCAVGTGTMMAGIISRANPQSQVIGISVLKNHFENENLIRTLIKQVAAETAELPSWRLIHDYHFGGYARHSPALIRFMNEFFRQTGIPTDFVYTGKLLFAVNDLVQQNFFPPHSELLIIHSGGLQGNDSLDRGTLMF